MSKTYEVAIGISSVKNEYFLHNIEIPDDTTEDEIERKIEAAMQAMTVDEILAGKADGETDEPYDPSTKRVIDAKLLDGSEPEDNQEKGAPEESDEDYSVSLTLDVTADSDEEAIKYFLDDATDRSLDAINYEVTHNGKTYTVAYNHGDEDNDDDDDDEDGDEETVSTFCGSMTQEQIAEHVKTCEPCRKDFGGEPEPEPKPKKLAFTDESGKTSYFVLA